MTPRDNPIAEPRPVSPRPRRNALHGARQAVPTLPDPIDDETADLIDELVRNRAPSDAQVASASDD